MASGLVPMTSLMSAERSLPPSSAGRDCLRYELISTKIVGVGLKAQPDRRRRDDVVAEAVPIAVGDRRLLARESHPDLRIGVARAVPPGQRIGPKGLLPLKLEQPAARIGLAGLGRPAVGFGNSRDGHDVRAGGKVLGANQVSEFTCYGR